MDRTLSPHPFAYAPGIHVRRHGPSGWADYRRYRPWLRDEFSFRCVYCLNRERWMDTRRGYQLDHFVPQKLRPDLRADYDNLLYLCSACNSLKSAALLPDPCSIALSECLRFHDDGSIQAISPNAVDGERLIEVLELDQPQLIQYRRIKIAEIKSHAVHQPGLYQHLMGYPDDVPDLSADPPPVNAKPEGISTSAFARKHVGTLALIY